MKLYKTLMIILTLGFFVSCDPDKVDDIQQNDPSLFFSANSGTFFVAEGDENIYDVNLIISDAPSKNLSYEVEIDPSSSAMEGVDFEILNTSYFVESGKTRASIQVQGDVDAATTAGKELILNLVSLEDGRIANFRNKFTLLIKYGCPLAEGTFLGEYTVTQLTPGLEAAGGVPTFGDGTVLELTETSEFGRQFETVFYPDLGIGQPAATVMFELDCGEVKVPDDQNSNLACSGAALNIGSPDTNATFDETDDSTFTITFTEDSTSGCGEPQQTTVQLTKVQ
ncbi:hypothetical protein [Mesonia sp. K7]|uniref:hypothetical protein n=1 Tax=Mesonia sp. K7 TaxID=2218606 RepID=UPI000DA87C63|nr:hypothetical protein [Mesonia sp. K7]PZD77535.1 hypothetical protein DNG35_08100 [Mesonia sp. K7]